MEKKSEHTLRLKLAGLCGLLSFIILIIWLSIQGSLWFSWTENWLSQLARSTGEAPIWSRRGIPSIIFNWGLIISGMIGIMFSLLIRKSQLFKKGLGKIIPSLISIDMLAMCGCGMFPLTMGRIHVLCSIIFLGIIPLILLFIGFEIKRLYGKKWWWMTNLLCSIMILSLIFFVFMPDLSIFSRSIAEMLLIFSIYIIVVIISTKLLGVNLALKKYNINLRMRAILPYILNNKKLFRLPKLKGWNSGKYQTNVHKKHCNKPCKKISRSV